MSEEPASAPPPSEPAAGLPAIVTPPGGKTTDRTARLLGALALVCGIGALAYNILQHPPPAPQPAVITPQIWQATQQQTASMASEIAALRQNLQTLQEHPPSSSVPPVPDAATPEQTRGALAEIDKLRAALNDIKGSIAGTTAVQQELTQLKHDLAVANTAIAAMNDNVRRMADTAHKAAAAEDATRAQVIAYLQLRNAAATATPFADELQKLATAAKNVPDLPGLIAKLDNAAHAGVATLPMLQARFNVMSGPAEQALAMAAAQNWWDKLAASFQEVISIRKIGREDGGANKDMHDAAAALQRGNIAEAVARVEHLPPVAQKHMQEWLTDARARIALDATLAQIGVLLGQSAPHGETAPPPEQQQLEPSNPKPQKPESGTP